MRTVRRPTPGFSRGVGTPSSRWGAIRFTATCAPRRENTTIPGKAVVRLWPLRVQLFHGRYTLRSRCDGGCASCSLERDPASPVNFSTQGQEHGVEGATLEHVGHAATKSHCTARGWRVQNVSVNGERFPFQVGMVQPYDRGSA